MSETLLGHLTTVRSSWSHNLRHSSKAASRRTIDPVPQLTCPHCQVLTNFTFVQRFAQAADNPRKGEPIDDVAVRCENTACGRIIGGLGIANVGQLANWWPRRVGNKDFPDVPNEIASVASEAHQCLSIGAYRAAMALARAVIEATAKSSGADTGTLEAKVEALAKKGLIRSDTKEAAHAIRLVGNDAAHGDLANMVVDEADAKDVLDLVDDVLDEVFQSPAKVARVIAGRQARRGVAP
jgi:hypothetical protein